MIQLCTDHNFHCSNRFRGSFNFNVLNIILTMKFGAMVLADTLQWAVHLESKVPLVTKDAAT